MNMEKNKKIVWGNSHSIGNKEIDNDHKHIIDIYNQLIDLLEGDHFTSSEFARVLSEMTDYSLRHFQREENYMLNLSYPNYEQHVGFHRDYIYKVAIFNVNLMSSTPPSPQVVLNFLYEWWNFHIMRKDVEYENFKSDNDYKVDY